MNSILCQCHSQKKKKKNHSQSAITYNEFENKYTYITTEMEGGCLFDHMHN